MATAPAFATFTPSVINTGAQVHISIPIGNTGTAAASSLWLTGGTLGSAQRLSPAVFRIFIGDLDVGNNANVNMVFSGVGLTAGSRYLLAIRGTYTSASGSALGFSLNRFVVIPPPTSLPIAQVNAAASVQIAADSWSYSIVNNESAGSDLFIASFSLDVTAPVNIVASPIGWVGVTDNTSYVAWYANDPGPPYPNQIAPGSSVSGFQIESAVALSQSTAYILTAWNHSLDAAGLTFSDYISSPSQV